MKIFFLISILLICAVLPIMAQQTDTTKAVKADTMKATPPATQPPAQQPPTTPPPAQASSEPSKIYYGGSFGITFGSYRSISISPEVGYSISPMLSAGLRGNYEYVKDSRYTPELSTSNYGGSVFARARLHPNIYAHAEFEYMSYEYQTGINTTTREWVPFLYLGGGIVKEIAPHTSFIAQVLFDVLQDSKSPYDHWTPMFTVGVVVGF